MGDYGDRVEEELAGFAELEDVHGLPAIFDHWAGHHLRPLLDELGIDTLDGWWDDEVAALCAARAPRRVRLVSLGAGNGDLEIELAGRLAARGHDNLELELLELNSTMLDRALAHAERVGVADRLEVVVADLNTWRATRPADIYLACHSLHHVVELEHLLDEVAGTIAPDGVVLVNDMVGRNGHRRWPEALAIVEAIWRVASPRHRVNVHTGCEDVAYPDLDCSTQGFEGVRAQDILPLLLERLHPEVYITFGNVIDPFVDRVYGPNFDPANDDDRRFIDAVAAIDDATIDLGVVKPTHLVASFRSQPVACRYPRRRSPEHTLRRPTDPPFDPVSEEVRQAQLDATARQHEATVLRLQREATIAWNRLHALQARKIVRLGIALARLRRRGPR